MKKLFLSSVIALGLVACSDSNESGDNGGGSQKGNTYTSVEVSLSNGLKAGGQTDNAGTPSEQVLSDLIVLSSAGDQNFSYIASAPADLIASENEFWSTVANKTYTTSAWKTAAGPQILALLFNQNTATAGTATATASQLFTGWSTALSPAGKLTMTSKAIAVDVKPNISKEIASTGTSEAENVFGNVEVERVVAKGIVKISDNLVTGIKDAEGNVVGNISKDNIEFAAVNGAKKTYLYRDNAGERKMNTTAPFKYDRFTSAIHALVPTEIDTDADAAGLVRLGIAGVPTEISKAKAVNAYSAKNEEETTNSFYFFENSGDFADATNMKSEGYYRFAYAKIYATYTPVSLMEADKTAPADFVEKAGTGKFYKEKADGSGYEESDANDADAKEGFLVWKLKTITNIQPGTTFYKGASDGILYASLDAAKSSKLAPWQSAYKYTEGRCGYRTLWNRQEDAKGSVQNADVRRNNTYMITVSEFAKLGFPWDESDPNDPNLPKPEPEDPNQPEPEDPTDPHIEPQDTYMRVVAEVLQWNLVVREDATLH